ncbi:ThuA domain-containing protein [Maribellus sp. CM-23]|uniref:ThuA domain-containing protein n=1 Tax=Maribellus sp. CM-23 TaxID=2781026 RepID=UPI001F1E6B5E|nr:ThuA domain-containing protein [Maribellus sp. CM-23]MCE4564821.1 ThuA domain-containing protein [Maribellus sp. CM-23]
MRKSLFTIYFASLCFLVVGQPIKVMLVTGGHSYDTLQFFQLFDAMSEIEYEHFEQPAANQKIAKDLAKDFDLIVFYDMWDKIGVGEREAYRQMGKQGKPLLFLHHSLASYQEWPEFEKIIGGKYVEKGKGVDDEEQSTYEHDVWVYCNVENYTSVTRGFRELRFFDEVYGNVRIDDKVLPLLSTRHPKSMEYVAWENRYQNARVVYIQPGHDKRTYSEPDYQKLILQAIHYLAKK